MTDLDDLLDALRARPTPEALGGMEAGVLRALPARREAMAARRGIALAGVVAAAIGFAAAPASEAPAREASLFGIPANAPSQLLGQ